MKRYGEARRARRANTIALGVVCMCLLAALLGLGAYKYQHTFSVRKWEEDPEERNKLVASLLDRYELVGMVEADIVALLGPEDSEQSSFKLSDREYPPESALVYYLGPDLMDDRWLVISLEEGVAVGCRVDIS